MQVVMDSNRDFEVQVLDELRVIRERMEAGFASVDARFESVDARFESVDLKFIQIFLRLAAVEAALIDLRADTIERINGIGTYLMRHDAEIKDLQDNFYDFARRWNEWKAQLEKKEKS
jgi:hypothetical protein